jgi:hypothetical protein
MILTLIMKPLPQPLHFACGLTMQGSFRAGLEVSKDVLGARKWHWPPISGVLDTMSAGILAGPKFI